MIAASAYDPLARIDEDTGAAPAVACAPLAHSDKAQAWVATRHGDCARILRDRTFMARDLGRGVNRVLARAGISLPYLQALGETSFFGMSGDEHKHLRNIFAQTLGDAPSMAEIRPVLTEAAERLWQAGVDRGSLDVVADYADPLVTEFAGLVLGIDAEERAAFADCVKGLNTTFNAGAPISTYRETERKLQALAPHVGRLVRERRSRPRQDCMTRFAALAAERDASDVSVVAALLLLYLATSDQTSAVTALSIRALLADPDAFASWQAGTCDEGRAVQELFRTETSVSYTVRVASVDSVVDGRNIQAGERIMLLLDSANRDPEVFASPFRIDLDRAHNPHLAFSAGHHGCLGARIASAGLGIALAPMRRAAPRRALTRNPGWWNFDFMRRMKTFEVAF